MAPPPARLLELAGRVEQRLRELVTVEAKRWGDLDADLGPLFEALDLMLVGGGKRLRPAFCHWGAAAAGAEPDDPRVLDAGCALELLHAFALFHDDVMDGSATRRGLPACHVTFAERHAELGGHGEARRFGEGVAILVGDLAFVYADALLVDAPRAALEVWNELRLELNVGQYLDLLGAARGGAELASARRICRYKSAKYTIERPLHLGAALVGGSDRLAAPLTAYGLPLGEAFQLRDDLLGAFGDEAATGKPVGDDLREGKPTPLLATARERATAEQREVLARVGDLEMGADGVAAVQQALLDTGAVQALEDEIGALRAEALAALDGLAAAGVDTEVRDELAALADYVTGRDH